MIAPHDASSLPESIRRGVGTFHALRGVLRRKGYNIGVGDEGGFAPDLRSNEEAVEVILAAITKDGYRPGDGIALCLDRATSEMWQAGEYVFFKPAQARKSFEEMVALRSPWCEQYPIAPLEDGISEHGWEGWGLLTDRLGPQLELVRDDLFCTNQGILTQGIQKGVANAILIKFNQSGTLTGALDTAELARQHHYKCCVPHRSGERADTTIADLTVTVSAGQLKTGPGCRSERVAKFNQLLRIERQLRAQAPFYGQDGLSAAGERVGYARGGVMSTHIRGVIAVSEGQE